MMYCVRQTKAQWVLLKSLNVTDMTFCVQVVDTTGAGDCFTGAVAVGVLEGMSYQDAMKFAGLVLWSPCLHRTLSFSADDASLCCMRRKQLAVVPVPLHTDTNAL